MHSEKRATGQSFQLSRPTERNEHQYGRETDNAPAWHLSFVADFYSPSQWEQLFLTGERPG